MDLCPESAHRARKKILDSGQKIVGWYHSHPTFKVEPSVVDIQNHENYQKMFENDGQPFLGVIIGPYYNTKCADSLLKIFHNKKGIPYSLTYRLLPTSALRKTFWEDTIELFVKYKLSIDKIDFEHKWGNAKETKRSKFLKSIEILIRKMI